jgi:ankyrin repeat protein
MTPLHTAAVNGSPEIAELLIARGANVHAKRSDGKSPLHVAAYHGKYGVVRVLAANGADLSASISSNGGEGSDTTPRDEARDKAAFDAAWTAGLADRPSW